jgi:deazaflavin-dependent oxidoreductase (nitroreductase family)
MSARRRAARFNRLIGNQIPGRILPLLPGFGAVQHRGRRSGRLYRTPVKVFRRGDSYVMSLAYGPDSDWVKNVVAAGGCELMTGGHHVRLTTPWVFEDRQLSIVPKPLRPVLRAVKAFNFIELRIADAAAPSTSSDRGAVVT